MIGTTINTNKINGIPLTLVYILYPIIGISSRLAGYTLPQNWLDGLWGLLLLFSLFFVLVRRRFSINRSLFIFIFVFLVWICLRIPLNLIGDQTETIPLVMELKPLFYLIFAWIWINMWGVPDEDKFISGGAWLGAILIADFVIEGIAAGHIIRIRGSGEINYDAALLVLSSCFLIANKKLFPKKYFWKMALIFLGLLASLSRTGLIVEILLLFFFWQSKILVKASLVLVAFASVLVSFWIRNLTLSLQSVDRYWMWATAIELFLNHPVQFLFGFGVQPLPVIIPPQLAYLWVDLQQAGWGLSGIYAYNFHAFWLRFITSWGIVATIPLFYILGFFLLKQRSSKLLRILSLLFIMEGFTMGVIYLSNVGIPLIIAMLAGLINRNGVGVNIGIKSPLITGIKSPLFIG